MNAEEFNKLLKLQKYDAVARANFYAQCLSMIRRRLLFRNEFENIESLSHSILAKFLNHAPSYINAPHSYLNKCTDNYLSDRKKKEQRKVYIINDVGYEQYFANLENSDVYKYLEKYLDKLNAQIMFMYAIEEAKEKDIAQKLGIDMSYDAIRQRICRCKKILKEKMNKDVTKDDD